MAKILVVDDEKSIRNSLIEILEYEGYEVDQAEEGKSAVKMASDGNYDVIFCDIKMPKMDGMEVLEAIQEKGIDTQIVMISGHGNVETAVESIKKGAYDFIEKPLDLNRILVTIRNALEKTDLQQETKVLKRKIHKSKSNNIIGESQAVEDIKAMIEKVAPSDARVLITGANGSGKELVARQLHEQSARSNAPFVEVNCAAIPNELIESELFGHEKGSFTGAHKQKKGKFEIAGGGTLFLDEIGDMSPSAQAKVLRTLEENKITRVGGEKEIKVDVRIVAATNKNLQTEIEKGNFREDLFHRLTVILIEVPALNDRIEDIPILTEHFLQKLAEENGFTPMEITDKAIKALQKVNWTGNIRELRNIIERLMILCDQKITDEDVLAYVNLKNKE